MVSVQREEGVSGALGDKLIGKSSTLREWDFKYYYADQRIRSGPWTIIRTLKIHKLRFFAVEAVGSISKATYYKMGRFIS